MLDKIIILIDQNWIVTLFFIVLATLLSNVFIRKLLGFFLLKAKKTKNIWDDAFINALKKPLECAVWLFGINFAVEYTVRVNELAWGVNLQTINTAMVVILISWVLLRLISRMELALTSGTKLAKPMDLTTAKAVRKLLQSSVVITAILVILEAFDINVSAVLAFGGIGGIAIGFAAQDVLANFFGAMMIYLDKPFSVGDWIRSPDRSIEGVVEDIGWRQTIIRTFDKRPLYIPNSIFTKIAVENPSRMSNRRIYENIGIRYKDSGKVEQIVLDVKEMLENHDDIDQRQTLIVNLYQFSESSVDFMVYTFTKTTDWIQFHAIKQDILLKIENIITSHHAEVAYPTQTLLLDSVINDKVPQPSV